MAWTVLLATAAGAGGTEKRARGAAAIKRCRSTILFRRTGYLVSTIE